MENGKEYCCDTVSKTLRRSLKILYMQWEDDNYNIIFDAIINIYFWLQFFCQR